MVNVVKKDPLIEAFFDEATNTVSYVVACAETKRCAIIDPVLDFDLASARTSTGSADKLLAFLRERGLALDWILETHAHADHLTAAPYLRERAGGKIAIGAGIVDVQKTFATVYNLGDDFATDGSQFDRLLNDGDELAIGMLTCRVMHTPGHTPACVTYCTGNAAFVGDTMFMPDFGSARTDFPGGDAATLYRSIRRIFELPLATRLFMCHDYKAPGRDRFAWETTVAEQRSSSIHVSDGVNEQTFVNMRRERDAKLPVPKLLLPAIQVNIRAGALPPAESNGIRYLKLPLNSFS